MFLSITIVVLLLVLSAFFSAAETALFSLRESEIVHMKEKGIKNASLVFALRHQPERLLSSILIGNNIANMVAASYTTFVVAKMFDSYGVGVATGILTIAVLVFGEILPKSFALSHNRTIALLVAKPLRFLVFVLYPAAVAMQKLTKIIQKASGVQKKEHGVTEEELRYMMKVGMKSGFIEKDEHELIERVFLFNDTEVGNIITPIDVVAMFNSNTPMGDLIAEAVEHGYARYPVIDSSNTIVGYVTDYDIMRADFEQKQGSPVSDFITPIQSVPTSMIIDDVFRSMKKSGAHMHLVHDVLDSGIVLGIVTLEDLIEELFGEISDEEDAKEMSARKKIFRKK